MNKLNWTYFPLCFWSAVSNVSWEPFIFYRTITFSLTFSESKESRGTAGDGLRLRAVQSNQWSRPPAKKQDPVRMCYTHLYRKTENIHSAADEWFKNKLTDPTDVTVLGAVNAKNITSLWGVNWGQFLRRQFGNFLSHWKFSFTSAIYVHIEHFLSHRHFSYFAAHFLLPAWASQSAQ